MQARQAFSAIVYVLRTGCQWKALPSEFGSASAVHKHFQQWPQAGFFLRLWQAGLAKSLGARTGLSGTEVYRYQRGRARLAINNVRADHCFHVHMFPI
jgi:transposase